MTIEQTLYVNFSISRVCFAHSTNDAQNIVEYTALT